MEVKVDVHTVHPSSAKPVEKPPIPKQSCGSWCTPDSTPAHNVLTQTNSNIESKTEIQEDVQNKESLIGQLQKVRLFSSSPPPAYKIDDAITEADTELKPSYYKNCRK